MNVVSLWKALNLKIKSKIYSFLKPNTKENEAHQTFAADDTTPTPKNCRHKFSTTAHHSLLCASRIEFSLD